MQIAELGAEIKSVIYNDTEYMWNGRAEVWANTAPIMFPICGGLKNDTFDFAEDGILCAPEVFVGKDRKKILMDAAFEGGEITGTLTVNEIRDGVDTRGRFPKTVSFTLKGDGKRQIHEIDLEGLGVAFVGSNLEFTSVGHAKIYSFEFI